MTLKPIRIFGALIIIIVAVVISFSLFNKKTPLKTVTPPINIPNSSAEQVSKHTEFPALWNTRSWGTNDAKFTYLSTGHTGKHSLETTITAYTKGDAKWYFNPQSVIPGAQYIFKDYYKSNTASRIVVQFTKKNGSFLYKELKTAPPSTEWAQYQASFTVPTDTKTMTIFHLLSTVGFLITDDYQIINYVPVGFRRGLVSITWDDGVESQYTKAFPLQKKYNIHANFFLISGDLGKKFYMTTFQAKELQSAGNELGSHTVTHPHLTALKATDVDRELRKSKTDLQAKFGTSFNDFVTPYGDYNEQVLSLIKKYYRSHRSVEEGYNAKNNFDIYDIVVQNVYTKTPPSQVETWINKAKVDKTWLVLVYHQVDNPVDQYSVRMNDLDTELHYIHDSGLSAVTFDQALKELLPQINQN